MKEHVIKVSDRELPSCLLGSDNFIELNSHQQKNFVARLRHIEEISLKIREWLETPGQEEELRSFIDRVELDLMINLGVPTDPVERESAWLVHSSWAFDASVVAMQEAISSTTAKSLEQMGPRINCTLCEFIEWLTESEMGFSSAIDRFYSSDSYNSAIAHLIAIDVCMARVLAGVSMQRLNPNLCR